MEKEKDVSEEELKAFMVSLICDKFVSDPSSRFCDRCGYSRLEHREKSERAKRERQPIA